MISPHICYINPSFPYHAITTEKKIFSSDIINAFLLVSHAHPPIYNRLGVGVVTGHW